MRALRAVVHGIGELFITLGVLLLLFVAWQLWWTDVVAGRAQEQTARELEQTWKPQAGGAAGPPVARAADPGKGATLAQIPMGRAFALIRVPRFGRDYVRPILQGTELSVLDEGVGHYDTSAGPGQVGNFAVAGHRVTYAKPFNQIAELQSGDAVVVETRTTYYVYRVVGHTIVTPDRVDVVDPVPERPGAVPTTAMMTMTACHPEFSARERYVVYSALSQTVPKASGKVPAVLTAAAPSTPRS